MIKSRKIMWAEYTARKRRRAMYVGIWRDARKKETTVKI
jgi:hypothetical protein